jgi:Domain of unknown function (DUF222)
MTTALGCDRETVQTVVDRFEAACAGLAQLSFEALTGRELLAILARRETLVRQSAAVEHRLVNQLANSCTPGELGGTSWGSVLSERLGISTAEATRRVGEAADLGPRVALSGEPLEPRLPTFAAGVGAGMVGAQHIKIARKFFKDVPAHVDDQTRRQVEIDLGGHACALGPEAFHQAADRMLYLLDQDGSFSDVDRERRRGLSIGRQRPDGMSPISGLLDPQCRATFDAVLAKLAAPGMCNPANQSPQVDGGPAPDAVRSDTRTQLQRNHDALTAAGRALLASGQLGQLNGLPCTVIVSTTLSELQSGAGQGVTAGGSLLPISDLIRMASHAYHYLAVFDGKRVPLYLGRDKRFASPGQRIVLHSLDRGCTKPGCTAPGYASQAHHAECDWADGGLTNIDELTFACGPDNRLVANGGWRTRKRADGRTEWIPPPHLDSGQARVNDYHHPERLIAPPGDDSGP